MSPGRGAMVRRGRWSVGEIEKLREFYGMRPESAIARAMGRPLSSVRRMAERIFRGHRKHGPWSATEVQLLKRCLGVSPPAQIARILRRSEQEVFEKIAALGRTMKGGTWRREEVLDLKQLYGSRSDGDLARILGRPAAAIRREAALLRLSKDKVFLRQVSGEPSRMPRWTQESVEALRRLYPDHSNLEIARMLKRSVKSVVSKAHDLELKKDRERLAEMGRENVALREDRT